MVCIVILRLFPELAAIGDEQLQVYCDEWLQRPIAKQYAVAQITIDADLLLQINLELHVPVQQGEQILLPSDELLGYIVDRHFHDPTSEGIYTLMSEQHDKDG